MRAVLSVTIVPLLLRHRKPWRNEFWNRMNGNGLQLNERHVVPRASMGPPTNRNPRRKQQTATLAEVTTSIPRGSRPKLQIRAIPLIYMYNKRMLRHRALARDFSARHNRSFGFCGARHLIECVTNLSVHRVYVLAPACTS